MRELPAVAVATVPGLLAPTTGQAVPALSASPQPTSSVLIRRRLGN